MRLPRRAYDRYMRSPEWLERRQRFLTEHGNRCAVCSGTDRIHVHHLDYRHLGDEPDADLMALCNFHHAETHRFAEQYRDRYTLREATGRYRAWILGEPYPDTEPLTLRHHERWLEMVTVSCPTCEAQPGEACVYEHRGRVRIVTAGGAHKARKAAASRARRVAS